jgi:hypothetical protein
MSAHPASYRLEGHAAGDHDAEVAAHMVACEACRVYVERSVAAAQAAGPSPQLARALAAHRGRGYRPAFAALLVLAPLAAAAAVLLVVLRPVPPVEADGSQHPVLESMQFKGGLQVVTIRERGAHQERFAGSVGVRTGDRLRVEIGVDRERPVTAGVLADDGAWLTMLAPTLLGPGTHLSERAAEVDDRPIGGVILAGDPGEVERARASRDFAGVAVMAVHLEP